MIGAQANFIISLCIIGMIIDWGPSELHNMSLQEWHKLSTNVADLIDGVLGLFHNLSHTTLETA